MEERRRYKGHKSSDYKVDSTLTHNDSCVVSGSEDGKIYFWELVEVPCVHVYSCHCCCDNGLSIEYSGTNTRPTQRRRARRKKMAADKLCGVFSLLSPNTAMLAHCRVTGTSQGVEKAGGHEGGGGGAGLKQECSRISTDLLICSPSHYHIHYHWLLSG